jgi:hypothetical protein
MTQAKTNSKIFKKGKPKTGGRKPGVPNKLTREIREAILSGGEQFGYDGKGKDGLPGYFRRLAGENSTAYAALIGKMLPMKITSTTSFTSREKDIIIRQLELRNIPVTHIFDQAPIPVLEQEAKEVGEKNNGPDDD